MLTWSRILLLLLVWTVFSQTLTATDLTYEEATQRLVVLTVAVDRGEGHERMPGHASGFLINEDGIVLTVRHLVPEKWRGRLKRPSEWHRFLFFGQVGGTGEEIYFSLHAVPEDDRDVILLRANEPIKREYSFLDLSDAVEISAEAELVVFGFPDKSLARVPSSMKAPCTAAALCKINHKLPAGFSGGAVVEESRAVGLMVQSGIVQESTFIPLTTINHWISSLVQLPETPTAKSELVPRPLLPRDGTQLSVFPRQVTLQWSQVGEELSYVLEIEIQDPEDSSWRVHPFGLGRKIIATNSFTFNFVGSQPGRWRVAVRSTTGDVLTFSHWSYFDFSPRTEDLLQNETSGEALKIPSLVIQRLEDLKFRNDELAFELQRHLSGASFELVRAAFNLYRSGKEAEYRKIIELLLEIEQEISSTDKNALSEHLPRLQRIRANLSLRWTSISVDAGSRGSQSTEEDVIALQQRFEDMNFYRDVSLQFFNSWSRHGLDLQQAALADFFYYFPWSQQEASQSQQKTLPPSSGETSSRQEGGLQKENKPETCTTLSRERSALEVLTVLKETPVWDRDRTFESFFLDRCAPLPGWTGIVEGEPRRDANGFCDFLFVERGTRALILAKGDKKACRVRNRDSVTVYGRIVDYQIDMLTLSVESMVLPFESEEVVAEKVVYLDTVHLKVGVRAALSIPGGKDIGVWFETIGHSPNTAVIKGTTGDFISKTFVTGTCLEFPSVTPRYRIVAREVAGGQAILDIFSVAKKQPGCDLAAKD